MCIMLFSVSAEQSVARSPDENDRSGLLRQVEPVDYTGEISQPSSRIDSDMQDRSYQSERFDLTNRYSASSRGSATRPPRDIFDDV